jgi:branched-chain amino acid transport system substrate-binding protein
MVSYGDGWSTCQELVFRKMNYKTTLTIILLSVFALGILFLVWGQKQFLSSNSYEIAAVSMSGERKEDGISMTRGIKMCLDQVNASGGIFGKPVHLKLYDDRGDPKEARQIASSLVENQNIRLVLGHFFSSTSFAAGQIYKKYGLPAITASATDPMVTQSNPWFFRVIPTNNTQGQFIAAFIHGAMRQKRASIVYDTDNYGKSLARSFESSALELGIHLVKKWGINCIKNVDKQIKKTVEELRSIEDLGIIFLAMHSIEAVKLISAINFPGAEYMIFGPDSLSTISFIKEFQRFPQERSNPGYFSNHVYATSPFMINISPNPAAFKFRNDYIKIYGHKPSWVDSCYYDAAQVAITALKFCRMSGNNFRKDRMDIRKYLEKINQPDNAIKGITGDIYFDKFGNTTRPFSVGSFKKQKFYPDFIQYQTIKETPDQVYPINDIIKGELALVNNQLMKKGRVVYSGIDINEISHLNLFDACYTADFYLWFRFKGDFDVQNIVFLNAKYPIQLGQPVFKYNKSQIKTYTYHVKGIFTTQFNFKMYPFDNQQLKIQLRHKSKPREQVIYIPDISGMGKTGINPSKNNKQLNALNGWEVYRTDIYQSCMSRSSSLGNPSLFENPKKISYSLINVDIGIKRDNLDVAFRTIAPLFFISILMLIATCMPSHRPGLKIGILLTSFISTIIYHNKLLSVLKSIKISFVESIIFVLYALIIVYLIVVVFRYIAYKKALKRLLKGIFVAELLLFPIVICFCVYWFYFQSVSISELHNSNNLKSTESLAVGKRSKKEDILYWTFTLHNKIHDGDIIGEIKHKKITSYSRYQIIDGNHDNAFKVNPKTGALSLQSKQKILKQEKACREIIVSISNNTGNSIRSIVNICMENDYNDHPSNKKLSSTPLKQVPKKTTTNPEQDDVSRTIINKKIIDISDVQKKNKIGNTNTSELSVKKQNITNEHAKGEKKSVSQISDNERIHLTEKALRVKSNHFELMDQIFIIRKSIKNNEWVGQIKVRCPEKDHVRFKMISGNEKDIFSLHPESGVIFMKNNAILKETRVETFFLTVEINNQDQNTDRASITVLINP